MWVSISRAISRSRDGAGNAAHHHRDQRPPVAMHGGQQVEAGAARVAGLDAVDAVDAAEQMVVVADHLAVVGELAQSRNSGNIAESAPASRGRAPRGRAPSSVARRWAGPRRCDRACATCRSRAPCGSSARRSWIRVPPIVSATATAMSLAERVTIALIASSTEIESPGGTPSFEGSCAAACSETGIARGQRQLAAFELLEQQIERHHLGQRGGMAQGVLVDAPDLAAGVGVDDDGGIFAGVDFRRGRATSRAARA